MRCEAYRILVSMLYLPYIVAPPVDENSILSIPAPDLFGNTSRNGPKKNQLKPTAVIDYPVSSAGSCAVERTKSSIKEKAGDLLVYVPTCDTKDPNLYEPSQCHKTSNYCWCVHIYSGEPIIGTYVPGSKVRCQKEATTTMAPVKVKKNRCKGRRRMRFMRRLVATMKTEMIIVGNSTLGKITRNTAIQWKFNQLDKNKNKIVERSEWKPYKEVLLEWKKAKHCSRSLFKSCDKNKDRRLTMSEWSTCIVQEVNRVPAQKHEQLNPFLYILKPE